MNQDLNALQTQNGFLPGGGPTHAAGPAPMGGADGISLAEFLQILRRRRAVILQSFVLVTVVAVVLTVMTRPVYRASARLLVESPTLSYNAIDTANPLSGILALSQPQNVKTQVEVLQSPSLAAQVAKAVGPAALSVKEVEDTNLIEASAEANDPKGAAQAANTLLQLYIDQDTNESLGEMRSAEDFARRKEAEAHGQLSQAAAALEAYKNKNHIAELTAERNVQIQRVAGLTSDVETAQTNVNAYGTQISTLQKQLAAQPETITAQTQTTNPALKTLQNQVADLQLQRTALVQPGGFTAKAPRVKTLDAQIAATQARLDAQTKLDTSQTITPNTRRPDIEKTIADLQVQMASAQTVLDHKKQELADAEAKVNHYASWDTDLNRLTFNANNAAAQDKMFQDKIADLSLREQAHHATAHIDEYAQAPGAPVRPKKAYDITLGALFGLFIGVCLALLQEFLDDRINTVEDANRVLGLPSLGFVPSLTPGDAILLPQMRAVDPAAESYRLLRTNIQFAAIDAPIRTLVVTSASPGEGKTTTAANLAFAMALDGKNVILVDTDLRRPSLHKLLGLPTVPGLTDVLLGNATLEDTLLENSGLPNLTTLAAGSTPPNPSELLNSRRFRNLVDTMVEQSDIVIFDSPPVNASTDAPILASQMDGTVFVVEAGGTKKAPARHALMLLQKGRANVLGVAYNKMRALNGNDYYYYQYGYSTPALEKNAQNGAKPDKAATNGAKSLSSASEAPPKE